MCLRADENTAKKINPMCEKCLNRCTPVYQPLVESPINFRKRGSPNQEMILAARITTQGETVAYTANSNSSRQQSCLAGQQNVVTPFANQRPAKLTGNLPTFGWTHNNPSHPSAVRPSRCHPSIVFAHQLRAIHNNPSSRSSGRLYRADRALNQSCPPNQSANSTLPLTQQFSTTSLMGGNHGTKTGQIELFLHSPHLKPLGGHGSRADRLRLPLRRNGFNPRPVNSPDFRKWESCRTMPLVGEFFRRYPVFPALPFPRCYIFTSLHPHRDGMQERGKRENPEKTHRQRPAHAEMRENPPGIEPGSPWWEANGVTTTAPPQSPGETKGVHSETGQPNDQGGETGGNPEVLKHAKLANHLTAGFCGLSTVDACGMEWNSIRTWKQWRQHLSSQLCPFSVLPVAGLGRLVELGEHAVPVAARHHVLELHAGLPSSIPPLKATTCLLAALRTSSTFPLGLWRGSARLSCEHFRKYPIPPGEHHFTRLRAPQKILLHPIQVYREPPILVATLDNSVYTRHNLREASPHLKIDHCPSGGILIEDGTFGGHPTTSLVTPHRSDTPLPREGPGRVEEGSGWNCSNERTFRTGLEQTGNERDEFLPIEPPTARPVANTPDKELPGYDVMLSKAQAYFTGQTKLKACGGVTLRSSCRQGGVATPHVTARPTCARGKHTRAETGARTIHHGSSWSSSTSFQPGKSLPRQDNRSAGDDVSSRTRPRGTHPPPPPSHVYASSFSGKPYVYLLELETTVLFSSRLLSLHPPTFFRPCGNAASSRPSDKSMTIPPSPTHYLKASPAVRGKVSTSKGISFGLIVLRAAAGADSAAPHCNRRPTSPSPRHGTMRSRPPDSPPHPSENPRRDLVSSQTSSLLVEFPIRLATTQECSGKTGWRLSPPQRITRVGEDSRWRPKTLYILPQHYGLQSLTEAAWRVRASDIKFGRRLDIAGRRRVRCSWLEWTRGFETDERRTCWNTVFTNAGKNRHARVSHPLVLKIGTNGALVRTPAHRRKQGNYLMAPLQEEYFTSWSAIGRSSGQNFYRPYLTHISQEAMSPLQFSQETQLKGEKDGKELSVVCDKTSKQTKDTEQDRVHQ
ncbi:hypothetical protein PR048_017696 [Dryococelus australis]|uniref:Uncharacterized protein n=1 Tax=Dryococelus australis TaxID=614101 RepID=A0ABQ9HA74_9NEOP|nr:hypothetical protein PR048_017696 [Dryococelus australis]